MTRHARVAARAVATLAVVTATTLVWAAPAHAAAATIDVNGTYLYYTAATGQVNHLIISDLTGSPDNYEFFEAGGVPITSTDPACWHPDPGVLNILRCTAPGLRTMVVQVGDLDDAVVSWTDRAMWIYGGSGDDSLWLGGRVGVPSYGFGGSGNDTIVSGPGDDYMDGGPDADTAAYLDSAHPVTASLVTNTGGRSYDTDTFAAMENLQGGGANDILYGNDARNRIDGGWRKLCRTGPSNCVYVSGNDTLYGGGGNDLLTPGSGNDTVYAGAGNDEVWGGAGDDTLYGEGGDDVLLGGAGNDAINGGPGYDACSGGTMTSCEN